MVPLDKAMTSSYRLCNVHVSICSGLAAILNAKLLPAAITLVRQITVPRVDYRVWYSSVTVESMWLQSLWEIAFFLLEPGSEPQNLKRATQGLAICIIHFSAEAVYYHTFHRTCFVSPKMSEIFFRPRPRRWRWTNLYNTLQIQCQLRQKIFPAFCSLLFSWGVLLSLHILCLDFCVSRQHWRRIDNSETT